VAKITDTVWYMKRGIVPLLPITLSDAPVHELCGIESGVVQGRLPEPLIPKHGWSRDLGSFRDAAIVDAATVG